MPRVYFIDETFHTPSNAPGKTFYVLGVVSVDTTNAKMVRRRMLRIVAATRWHSSTNFKKLAGRQKLHQICESLGEFWELSIYVTEPIPDFDTAGEVTRAALMSKILLDVSYRNPGSSLVFEVRNSRGHLHADNSTINQFLSQNKQLERKLVSLKSPKAEPLLWLPDMLCSAYRASIMGLSDELLAAFGDSTRITRV